MAKMIAVTQTAMPHERNTLIDPDEVAMMERIGIGDLAATRCTLKSGIHVTLAGDVTMKIAGGRNDGQA